MNANVVMQVATTKQFGDMEIQVYENPAGRSHQSSMISG